MSDKKQNKVISKIEKLLRRTRENGASEAEVETALKLANKLMEEHNIEMADVYASGQKSMNTSDIIEEVARESWNVVPFEKMLVCAVAKFCEVQALYRDCGRWDHEKQKYIQRKATVFIGLATDVFAARCLLAELRLIIRASATRTLGKWKQSHWQYCTGFADALYWNVCDIVEAREKERAKHTNTTALTIQKSTLVKTYMDAEHSNIKTSKIGKRKRHSAEYYKGRKDGEEYEIEKSENLE